MKTSKAALALSLSAVIGLLLCACSADDISIPGSSGKSSSSSEYDPIPAEAYEFWGEEQPVDPSYYDGRYYAAAKGAAAGHWEKTDYQVLLSKSTEVTEENLKVTVVLDDPEDDYNYEDAAFYYEGEAGNRRIAASASFINDRYEPGQECDPSVTFKYEKAKDKVPGKIYGATYFADVTEGDDIFGQSVTVREYFAPRYGTDRGHQLTRGYGRNTENRHGGNKNKDGSGETSVCPSADFPAVVAEGDKIWLIADVVDGETWQVGIRKLVEFTWVMDPDEPPYGTREVADEEEHEESVGWHKNEYPGRWDLTDVIYIGSNSASSEKRGNTVKKARYGVDGQNICFTFNDSEEYFMAYSPFDKMYYSTDWFNETLKIYLDPVNEKQAGTVVCFFAFCDIEKDEEGKITSFVPTQYFHKPYQDEEIKRFSPGPEGKEMRWKDAEHKSEINFIDNFPEGSYDGEKKYLVYGGFDSVTGDCSMYNLCEYTYTEGPVIEWEHNSPGY